MLHAANFIAYLAIALVVVGAGGVHTVVAGVACALGVLAVCLQAEHLRRNEHRTIHVSVVGIGLALLAVTSFVQLVPVPEFVHRILNPKGLELTLAGLELVGAPDVGLRPLSLDPAATADRAIRFVALMLIAIWGANVRSRNAWASLGTFLVATGFATFAVGWLLRRAGGKSVFGIYDSPVGFRGLSTFINLNHGAAIYGFVAICSIATALHLRREKPRVAVALGLSTIAFVAGAVAHQSDGVLLAMAMIVPLVPGLAWFRAGRPTAMPRDVTIGVVLLSLASVVAIWWLDIHRAIVVFLERVIFSGEHGGRLELMRAGLAAAADYWPLGAGAGAVETVVPAYIDWSAIVPASIPVLENDTLELLLGFGIFVGGAALLCFVVQFVLVLRRAVATGRSMRYAVAIVSAVYFAIVAQMHFPLFALGLGLPMVAWLEHLWSRRMRPSRGRHVFGTGHVGVPRMVALGAVLAFAAATLVAAHAHYRWYPTDLPAELDEAEAVQLIRTKPTAHRTYVRLATSAARRGETTRAIAFAEHAVGLEPSPRVRLYLARVTALEDPDLAADLYRKLFVEGYSGGRFLRAMTDDLRATDLRLRVVEDQPQTWLRTAREILASDGPEPASDFIVGLTDAHPTLEEPYRIGTQLYLQMSQPTLARLWAEALRERERSSPESTRTAPYYMARALHRAGDPDRAFEALDESLGSSENAPAAHRLALQLRGDVDEADDDDLKMVRAHYDRLCTSPVASKDRRVCWETEAWLAEADDEFSAARRALERIEQRFGDPMPLAHFLVRTGRCKDLHVLTRSIAPESRVRKRVARLAAGCPL